MRKSFIPISIAIMLLLFISTNLPAIETAPRITDREIVERLTRVEEGINALNRRFDDTNKRIDELKDGQKALEGRIDNLIFAVLGCFVALIGIVIWDRRTTLAPAVRKNRELEEREDKVEKALKEYARKEPQLAEILRNVGIL